MAHDPEGLLIRAKAERARLLMESSAFQEFIAETEAGILQDWKNADTPAEREACHAAFQGIGQLLATLRRAESAAQVEEFKQAKRTPIAQT